MTVYESCPVFITPRFTLRRVCREDAPGLLAVYSDSTAQPYFNTDDRPSDFRYTTLREMEDCVAMWCEAYANREYVRWTIFKERRPVGTLEMGRISDGDHGEGLGLLRIDLKSMYEFPDVHEELLRTLLPALHEHFDCLRILTKALPMMERRRLALVLHGFVVCSKPLLGKDGIEYGNYWVHRHIQERPRIASPRG